MKSLLLFTLLTLLSVPLAAEVVTETVLYEHDGVKLEGYRAWDDSQEGLRPGILVIHDWTGVNDYTKSRCRQLAAMGYVAFAADIYGQGIRPKNNQEASQQATIYRSDRVLMRNRVNAGLAVLTNDERVDDQRVAAIGYCFGGGTVLELARSGADVAGVVSFHGNLDTPDPSVAAAIRCKILVCHGADDPYVPAEQVAGFLDEMRAADVDYQFVAYSEAVHSFTKEAAGDDNSTGAAYNADADRRSWNHMKLFFEELFE